MSSLYLFQFAALVFMLVNALFVALARLNARWKNKRYERSRLMISLPWCFFPPNTMSR